MEFGSRKRFFMSFRTLKLDLAQEKNYACNAILANFRVLLMAFQCSKVLNVDDNMYPMISRYSDFSIERHET
jgi:hypothetical protein